MSLDVNVQKSFKDFSLNAAFQSGGEALGILGASGCGKSMTLKCVAGIETPDGGKIVLNGRLFFHSGQKVNLKPQRRKVGYLFQSYALFPHMTVSENIGCGLEHSGNKQRQKRQNISALIDRLHLNGLEHRYPGQLSGGQQQRAALARILVGEPEVLLLDEPFSALDTHLKELLQAELQHLLRDYAGDVVLVSHNRDEIYRLCPRLLVLEHGRSVAFGSTKALFRNPGLLSVARLTGCKNFSRAEKKGEDAIYAVDWGLHLKVIPPIPEGMDYVGIRAHDFKPDAGDGVNAFPVTVTQQMESPFERSFLFRKADAGTTRAIWWTAAKEALRGGVPSHLRADPASVLLLRSKYSEFT